MQSLKQTLESGLDSKRYVVDATYDYSDCAANPSCSSSCSISDGAARLASTILSRTSPGANIIIIGYSMGGLIARDMLANNYQSVATNRKIAALVTLGTPNLGYPYGSLDSSIGPFVNSSCPILSKQMASDFRSQQATRTVNLSTYLLDLTNRWSGINFTSRVGYWMAASGGYCKDPYRTLDLTQTLGCPDYNKVSDGVVCDQSARYVFSGANNSSQTWYDSYAHASGVIMCGFSSNGAPLLFDPVFNDSLSQMLWNTVSAH
jgi:triacylglycerol esterase/lipase EstA (alpha/beta hydrolase family)